MPDLEQGQPAVTRKAAIAITGVAVDDEPGRLYLVQPLQVSCDLGQGVEAAQRVEFTDVR